MPSTTTTPRSSSRSLMEYHVRAGSSSGVSSPPAANATSPAYVLEWDEGLLQRRFLRSVDEFHAEFDRGARRRPPQLQRLFVLHGLPDDFMKAVRSSLDIDPAFIEAHAARRRYRPLRWRRDARFAHYEYPELVRGYRAGISDGASVRVGDVVDLMTPPPMRAISHQDLGAVFCHASLWRARQGDVLFLDRLPWEEPTSELIKARRQSVTKPYTVRVRSSSEERKSVEVQLADQDDIASYVDILQETLKDAAVNGDDLMNIFADIAYDHWIEFFEQLSPQPCTTYKEILSLYWQIEQSLEQNVDVANYLSRRTERPSSAYLDWKGLLARIERRSHFLPPAPTVPAFSRDSSGKKFSRQATLNSMASPHGGKHGAWGKRSPQPAPDENQRSLDRVSYMGAILLPLSIVSGILGMEGDFAPDGNKFFIFWAVAVPLAVISLVVIYADTLRKAEVWVEVAAAKIPSVDMGGTMPVLGHGSRRDEKTASPVLPVSSRRRERTKTDGAVPQMQTNLFAYNAGLEEQAIDMPVNAFVDSSVGTSQEGDEGREEPNADVIYESSTDGTLPKTWRRQQMGWAGALKAILGFRMRPANDVPEGMAIPSPPEPRRTMTL